MRLRLEEARFTQGSVHLEGSLALPATGSKHPAVIALHAASEGERGFALYQHLAEVLPRHGVAVLVYDRRGSGRSSGDFSQAGFEVLADDARAGIEWLSSRSDIDETRLGAWGVSQGGWLAPLLAAKSPLKCLAIVSGAGVSPARQMDYSAAYALRVAGFPDEVLGRALELRGRVNAYHLGKLERAQVQREIDEVADEPWFGHAYVGRTLPETVSKWGLEVGYDPVPAMAQVTVPTLLFYGETDPWVPVEESIAAWRAAAGRWVRVIRVPDGDHFMMFARPSGGRALASLYTDALVAWFTKEL